MSYSSSSSTHSHWSSNALSRWLGRHSSIPSSKPVQLLSPHSYRISTFSSTRGSSLPGFEMDHRQCLGDDLSSPPTQQEQRTVSAIWLDTNFTAFWTSIFSPASTTMRESRTEKTGTHVEETNLLRLTLFDSRLNGTYLFASWRYPFSKTEERGAQRLGCRARVCSPRGICSRFRARAHPVFERGLWFWSMSNFTFPSVRYFGEAGLETSEGG